MQSFRVRRIPRVFLQLEDGARIEYAQAAELECRACLANPSDGAEVWAGVFVMCHQPMVGQVIHCPDCGEQSVVPKKPRWS